MKKQLKRIISFAIVMMVSMMLVACVDKDKKAKLTGIELSDEYIAINAGQEPVVISVTTNPTSFDKSKLKWYVVNGTTETEITAIGSNAVENIAFIINTEKELEIEALIHADDISFTVCAKLENKTASCDIDVTSINTQNEKSANGYIKAYTVDENIFDKTIDVDVDTDIAISDKNSVNAAISDFNGFNATTQGMIIAHFIELDDDEEPVARFEDAAELKAFLGALLEKIISLEVADYSSAYATVLALDVSTVVIENIEAILDAQFAFGQISDENVKDAIAVDHGFGETASDVEAFFNELLQEIEAQIEGIETISNSLIFGSYSNESWADTGVYDDIIDKTVVKNKTTVTVKDYGTDTNQCLVVNFFDFLTNSGIIENFSIVANGVQGVTPYYHVATEEGIALWNTDSTATTGLSEPEISALGEPVIYVGSESAELYITIVHEKTITLNFCDSNIELVFSFQIEILVA